ncbi:helix-turn-helix domain-containing protein [Streptomyces sp. YIM 130001]|uniref:helix-turn-helix domain-containing protein n=1 Tax=Streptomyces sp. YIM 130001 TaxID=2259644 RepID=UPI0013C4840C|nr:helix-turn-helix domain-containing protein [Streptomyces sp. YIM 130001]
MGDRRGDPPPASRHDDAVALVELLARGWCDERIARALALSKRTVQRRVQYLMADHGCTSRFALGYALGAEVEAARRDAGG